MKTSFSLLAPAVAATVMLSSCATIFNRTTQSVKVTSEPSGLAFQVTDKSGGVVANGTTPGDVSLGTSAGYFKPESYTFTFRKNGKVIGSKNLTANMSGWYLGNILIGGLVGMLVVDPLTGAMFTLPDDVHFTSLQVATISQGDSKLRIASIDQLSAEQRKQLVRL